MQVDRRAAGGGKHNQQCETAGQQTSAVLEIASRPVQVPGQLRFGGVGLRQPEETVQVSTLEIRYPMIVSDIFATEIPQIINLFFEKFEVQECNSPLKTQSESNSKLDENEQETAQKEEEAEEKTEEN